MFGSDRLAGSVQRSQSAITWKQIVGGGEVFLGNYADRRLSRSSAGDLDQGSANPRRRLSPGPTHRNSASPLLCISGRHTRCSNEQWW